MSCDVRHSAENTKSMMQNKSLNLISRELKIFRISAEGNADMFNMPEVFEQVPIIFGN